MKRSPLRKRSKKLSQALVEYNKVRAEYLAAHPYCEWWMAQNGIEIEEIINGYVDWNWGFRVGKIKVPMSNQIHHKKGRGKYLSATEFFMAVSQEGHEWVHKNTKLSYERGYMLPRN